jgi:hypothetical protein
MKREKPNLFDRIAGIYGLLFEYQKRKYGRLLDRIYNELDYVQNYLEEAFG